jgi:hypothetical protein
MPRCRIFLYIGYYSGFVMWVRGEELNGWLKADLVEHDI